MEGELLRAHEKSFHWFELQRSCCVCGSAVGPSGFVSLSTGYIDRRRHFDGSNCTWVYCGRLYFLDSNKTEQQHCGHVQCSYSRRYLPCVIGWLTFSIRKTKKNTYMKIIYIYIIEILRRHYICMSGMVPARSLFL